MNQFYFDRPRSAVDILSTVMNVLMIVCGVVGLFIHTMRNLCQSRVNLGMTEHRTVDGARCKISAVDAWIC